MSSITALAMASNPEMEPMGFGERFSLALESDDVHARVCDRIGRNDRLEIVL